MNPNQEALLKALADECARRTGVDNAEPLVIADETRSYTLTNETGWRYTVPWSGAMSPGSGRLKETNR